MPPFLYKEKVTINCFRRVCKSLKCSTNVIVLQNRYSLYRIVCSLKIIKQLLSHVYTISVFTWYIILTLLMNFFKQCWFFKLPVLNFLWPHYNKCISCPNIRGNGLHCLIISLGRTIISSLLRLVLFQKTAFSKFHIRYTLHIEIIISIYY